MNNGNNFNMALYIVLVDVIWLVIILLLATYGLLVSQNLNSTQLKLKYIEQIIN